jgi:hypothetical protein
VQSSCNTSTKRAYKITYTHFGRRRFIGPFEKNDMAALYAGIAALKSGIPDYLAHLKISAHFSWVFRKPE